MSKFVLEILSELFHPGWVFQPTTLKQGNNTTVSFPNVLCKGLVNLTIFVGSPNPLTSGLLEPRANNEILIETESQQI